MHRSQRIAERRAAAESGPRRRVSCDSRNAMFGRVSRLHWSTDKTFTSPSLPEITLPHKLFLALKRCSHPSEAEKSWMPSSLAKSFAFPWMILPVIGTLFSRANLIQRTKGSSNDWNGDFRRTFDLRFPFFVICLDLWQEHRRFREGRWSVWTPQFVSFHLRWNLEFQSFAADPV